MKTTQLICSLLFISQLVFGQDKKVKSDTTQFMDGRIIIIYNDQDSVKQAKRLEFNTNKSSQKKRQKFEKSILHLDLGFANYMDRTDYASYASGTKPLSRETEFFKDLGTGISDNDFALKTGKSININFGIVRLAWSLYKNHVNIVSGLSYDINSYSYKRNIIWNEAPLSTNISNPRQQFISRDSVAFKKNKLVTNYIQIPLMLKFETNPTKKKKNFTFAAGGYGGYLIRSHTKQIMKGDDDKNKNFEQFNLNKFQLGLQAEISYRDFLLYYRLNLTSSTEFGLNQYPYSFGIRILGS